jgi:ketosteroid isomerase-like protein
MSQENVEIVRRTFKAFNRGDFEAVAQCLHPDVEFFRAGGQSPVRGATALRAWMEPEVFEEQRFEPLDFTVNGNKVLVHSRITGRGAGSGIELDFTGWGVWTFDEEGLVTRLEAYLPHQNGEAREAAGLRE